ALRPPDTNAYRLVHGEGDRLPGVVVDAYDRVAVVRFDGAGAEALEAPLLEALWPMLSERGFDTLLCRTGRRGQIVVRAVHGAIPGALSVVREHGLRLVVYFERGYKTGRLLDHGESRHMVRSLAEGRRVLSLCSYAGGFSVAAGLGGAIDVVSVDVA